MKVLQKITALLIEFCVYLGTNCQNWGLNCLSTSNLYFLTKILFIFEVHTVMNQKPIIIASG